MMKMDEFESCSGVSLVRRKVKGVSKCGNKWQARARDPKLRMDVNLGCYSTQEEAALAVKKKKLEFEEMYKGEDGVSFKSCKGYFNGVKLPRSVRADNGRWRVDVWHPKLRCSISCGSYKTCEEAAVVAEMKRAELLGLQESNSEEAAVIAKMKRAEFLGLQERKREGNKRKAEVHEDRDLEEPESEVASKLECLQEPKTEEAVIVGNKRKAEVRDLEELDSEVASKSECLQEQTGGGGAKVPCGVERVKAGKWVARIRDPVARSRIWVGTYDTADKAIRSFNMKKDLLDAKMARAAFDGSEFGYIYKRDSYTDEGSVKVERELGYDSPSSSLVADCLNNIAVDDDSMHGVRDTPGKVGNGLVHCSPTSVLEAKNSNSASVSDKACGLEFDKAVSSGFIDEYGRLLGQFKELDEQMPLSLSD